MGQVLRGPDGSFQQSATLRLFPTLANRGVLIELLEDALEFLKYRPENPPRHNVPEDQIDPFAFEASNPEELPDLPDRDILRQKDLAPDNVTTAEHVQNQVKRASLNEESVKPVKPKRKRSGQSKKQVDTPSPASKRTRETKKTSHRTPKGQNRRRGK